MRKFFIKHLGEIVKAHREKLNKSIYALSAEVSVPCSTWHDVEFGVSNDIKLSNFCKIAEGLEMSPTELMEEFLQKLGKDFSFVDLDE